MNLRFRLAFLFSISVFIILLISSFSIHFLNEDFRVKEFNKRLLNEAYQSEVIYKSREVLNKAILNSLDENALNSLTNEFIFVYDSTFNLLYTSPQSKIQNLNPSYFAKAKKSKYRFYVIGKREGVLLYSKNIQPHFIVVSAIDFFGRRKSDNLKLLLIASVLGGLMLSAMLVFVYVSQALKPLNDLKKQIENINENNLKQRLSIKGNNEVAKIGKQFNAMLYRIEQAFEQRKSFVQHASHELRTPLANMLAQTEAAIEKTLSPADYNKVLLSLKEDQQNLIDLINSLLALSQYQKMPSLDELPSIRLDELLFQTTDFINQEYPHAIITVDFETVPENEDMLLIKGNEILIKSALQNLIKNAIHYSYNQKVKISISIHETFTQLVFENIGKQINELEHSKLFIPFFRGENSIYKKGYGLGLSIVHRIIVLHKGTISYKANGNEVNSFTVTLPREKKK